MKKRIRMLVEKILREEFLDEGISIAKRQHPFKALMIVGPAGSGKTHTSKTLGVPKEALEFVVNTDDVVEKLFPKFKVPLDFVHNPSNPMAAVQKKLRTIAKSATASKAFGWINAAQPIFIDTTGEDPVLNAQTALPSNIPGRLKALTDLGYDVGIVQVYVPRQTSVRRDAARERTVGDKVTSQISDTYLQQVVVDKGYEKIAEENPNVYVLNKRPLNNVYNTGARAVEIPFEKKKHLVQPGDLLPGVEEEYLSPGVSLEAERETLEELKRAVGHFYTPRKINNPTGKVFYEAMLELLRLTKGTSGQYLTDLPSALAVDANGDPKVPGAASEPMIVQAADILDDVAGGSLRPLIAKGAKRKKPMKKAGSDQPKWVEKQLQTMDPSDQKKFVQWLNVHGPATQANAAAIIKQAQADGLNVGKVTESQLDMMVTEALYRLRTRYPNLLY